MKRARVFMSAMVLGSLMISTGVQAANEGSISGTVTNVGGQNLAGICVDAGAGRNVFSATTAADGTYSISVPASPFYKVSFTDCSTSPVYLTQWYNNQSSYDSANDVSVSAGSDSAGVNGTLQAGGIITGTVHDDANRPIQVCVSALDDNYQSVGVAYSGADGSYRLSRLPSGHVKVVFAECDYPYVSSGFSGGAVVGIAPLPNGPGHGYVVQWFDNKPDFGSAIPVPTVGGVETPNISASLAIGAGITGTVKDSSGANLQGICVSSNGQAGGGFAFTDEHGFYSLDQLPAGSYTVGFFDCEGSTYLSQWYNNKPSPILADAISLAEGAASNGINAVLQARPRPDFAITKLEVHNVPITTDLATLPGSGMQRTINVSTKNLGSAPDPDRAELRVWVTMKSGQSKDLGYQYFNLQPGESKDWSFAWDATGSIGDAEVHATVCSSDDSNPNNDNATVQTYSIVGGTGRGFSLDQGGSSTSDRYCSLVLRFRPSSK